MKTPPDLGEQSRRPVLFDHVFDTIVPWPCSPFDTTPALLLAHAEWAVQDRRQAFVAEYDLALA